MHQPSSSIFNFKSRTIRRPDVLGRRKFRGKVFAVLASTAVSLAALDVAVDYLFGLPPNPQASLSTMQTYFDYGRSVEGKLRRMVGVDAAHDAPIIEAGWLRHDCSRTISIPAGKTGVEIYGNSFTYNIANAMEELDPGLAIEHFGGPGAPPSHSYACFLMREESGKAQAPIQIIGVLGGSMRRMLTISGITTAVEQPQPFTYPRYTIGPDGGLVPHWASIQSADELRLALNDRTKWRAFVNELASTDAFYVPEMVSANFADQSVVLRMIRRAWGQRLIRDRTEALRAETGFSGAPEIVAVIRGILMDFANRARAAGQRPVVILIEDRGYGGLLSAILAPMLRKSRIEYIATGEMVTTDDPHNFVPDGHFTPAVFSELARAILRLLNTTR